MVGHLLEPRITPAGGFTAFVLSGGPPLFSGSHDLGFPRGGAAADFSVGALRERPG